MYLLIFKMHWASITAWCLANHAYPHFDANTWGLEIRRGQYSARLQPRFIREKEGRLSYIDSPHLGDVFVGWVEPAITGMVLAQDKLSFKQTAHDLGLRVPAAWNHGEALCSHVLVKHRKGSFGRDIEGPWTVKTDAPALPHDEAYFEQFIPGLPLKAWVFEGRVQALEEVEQPCLVGDGQRSLTELAKPRGSMDKPLPLEEASTYLRWQGWTLDSVPPAGRKVWLSYLYRSPFHGSSTQDPDCWPGVSHRVREQLKTAASCLWQSLPKHEQLRRLFTLDAVRDQDDRVWLLEANSHPMIHPKVYPALLDALFKPKG